MSEDKIEVAKADTFTTVNVRIVRQASEFLDSQGKIEMALMIRTLLDENTSWNKKHLAVRNLDFSSLPNNGKLSEVRYCSILIMMISNDSTILAI